MGAVGRGGLGCRRVRHEADPRLLDRVQKLRVLQVAAGQVVVADVEDVRHVVGRDGQQVHVAEDHGLIVAGVGRTQLLQRLVAEEVGARRVVERHLDDPDERARPARCQVVDEQPVVREIRGGRERVRAAAERVGLRPGASRGSRGDAARAGPPAYEQVRTRRTG